MVTQRYIEDFAVGDKFYSSWFELSAGVFDTFATLTGDDHPLHKDQSYAESRGFRAPVAHGLLLTSLTALGATAISSELQSSMIAMTRQETCFKRPVLLGDSIRTEYEVESAMIESSRRGRLRLALRVQNQDGEVVFEGLQEYLLSVRDGGEDTGLKNES